MVKTASLNNDGKTKISEHFSVYETASTSGNPYNPTKIWNDTTYYDTDLVDQLELLYNMLDAKEARVSSWYRTPAHDKNVGGNGAGWHTKGKAADICFIGQDSKIIDSRIISCIAQYYLSFNGIARINNNYIHLDVGNRTKRYLGDETKSYNTVTTDFYKYYNLSMKDVEKYIKNPIVCNNSSNASSNNSIPALTYQVYTDQWLPDISNSDINSVNNYAGIEKRPIRAFRITASDNINIKYRIHIKEINSWTSWIESKNDANDLKTYAGTTEQNYTADGLQMAADSNIYDIYYRVSALSSSGYYPYVKNDTDYAGKFGLPIDKVQAYIKKK